MSDVEKNSDNEELINSAKKTYKDQEINKNKLSQENVNNSKNLIDSKKVLLNTLVNITVELGKSKIKIKDFLRFSKGSMLILDKSTQDPLDIFINGHLIASGEIVVLEKQYGLRITRIKNCLKTMNILS